MELVTFLSYHTGRIEKSSRGLARKKNLEFDDALQLVLLAADDLLRDVCLDLDGRYTHLRSGCEFYRAVDPRNAEFARYICASAYRDALNDLRGAQQEFEANVVPLSDVNPEVSNLDQSIVVQDLIARTLSFAESKGEAKLGVLLDLLANEGLADYCQSTITEWGAALMQQPRGRSSARVPQDFIFKAHGLTSGQGRIFIKQVAAFLKGNGVKREAA